MSFGNSSFSDYKQSVRVVATTNQNISSAPASIDGITLSAGDRVLLTGQTTGANNGIYEFNGSGSVMTRAGDSKSDRAVTEGMRVWVGEGNTYADSEWILTTNDPITVGSTTLNFVQGAGVDSAYVKIVGDTMTGDLTLSSADLLVDGGHALIDDKDGDVFRFGPNEYTTTPRDGITLRAPTIAGGEAIFTVESVGFSPRLIVEHAGSIKTSNAEYYAGVAADGTGGNKVWHEGNDGTGSGLDADTVDGNEATALLSRANHTGTQTLSTISDAGTAAASAATDFVAVTGDDMTGTLNITSGNLDVQAGDVIAANAKMGEHPTTSTHMAIAHEDYFGAVATLALWQSGTTGVTVLNSNGNLFLRYQNTERLLIRNTDMQAYVDIDMQTNDITNVGTVDGVDVSAHASRHEANGADALAWGTIHGYGTTASRPAAAATNSGYLFYSTDGDELSRSNGSTWDALDIAPAAHASTHIRAGSDEIDGDQLDVDYVPTYYTRSTSPTEVTSTQHLTAHFAGVDDELDGLRFPPLYSCYRGGAQNATTSWSDITWDNESGDQKFNETVGASIQVPETGEYMIIAQMTIANGSGDDWQGIRVLIAGSEVARATNRASNGNAVQVTTFNSLTTGQAVRIQKIANATRAITVGAQFTWFRIVKIGD